MPTVFRGVYTGRIQAENAGGSMLQLHSSKPQPQPHEVIGHGGLVWVAEGCCSVHGQWAVQAVQGHRGLQRVVENGQSVEC